MGGTASALHTLERKDSENSLLGRDDVELMLDEKLFAGHINLVLGEERGKEAYQKFLNREFPMTNCAYNENVDKRFSFGKSSDESDEPKISDIIESYHVPPEIESCEELTSFTKLRTSKNGSTSDDIAQEIKVASNLIAVKVWPKFLVSEEFHAWKSGRHNSIVQFRDDLVNAMGDMITDENSARSRTSVHQSPISVDVIDKEFERIVSNQSWLAQLLSSVDSLPLCVSIASARKGRKGFPLIYVNKFFEATTGYSREEILGQNCQFLQKGRLPNQRSEATSVARLTDNLRAGLPVKVVITNFRKDGSPFMNLLALKPIFESNGDYAFVVGIQFDVGRSDSAHERLEMVERLMSNLPDKISSTCDTDILR